MNISLLNGNISEISKLTNSKETYVLGHIYRLEQRSLIYIYIAVNFQNPGNMVLENVSAHLWL